MRTLKAFFTNYKKKCGEESLLNSLSDMAAILGIDEKARGLNSAELQDLVLMEFHSASNHTFINMLATDDERRSFSYLTTLYRLADNLGIKFSRNDKDTPAKVEKKIIQFQFEELWKKMDDKQKKDYINNLKKSAQIPENVLGSLLTAAPGAAALLLLGAGGLGPYIAATTALSAVSSAIGLTLSFGVYTGITRGISMLIGPVGWAITGALFAFQAGKPNYNKKILPVVLLISKMRSELNIKS